MSPTPQELGEIPPLFRMTPKEKVGAMRNAIEDAIWTSNLLGLVIEVNQPESGIREITNVHPLVVAYGKCMALGGTGLGVTYEAHDQGKEITIHWGPSVRTYPIADIEKTNGLADLFPRLNKLSPTSSGLFVRCDLPQLSSALETLASKHSDNILTALLAGLYSAAGVQYQR